LDAAHELARHNDIVQSLEAFVVADDLKKLALESIAFSTPPAKLEELRHIFVQMDEDDSGTISMDEFKKAMSMHPEIPINKVESMFRSMDVNGNGEVDYLEFLSATISTQKNGQEKLTAMAAFSILDRDGDGFINRDDILQALDGHCTEDEVDDMLIAHGTGDGKMDVQGFKQLLFSDAGQQFGQHLSRVASQITSGSLPNSMSSFSAKSIGEVMGAVPPSYDENYDLKSKSEPANKAAAVE